MDWLNGWTLAQSTEAPTGPGAAETQTQTQPPAGGQGAPTGGFGGLDPWFMMIMIVGIFWVLIFMPQRREKKKHAALMSALKKGDRVQTIGGMLATVVEVRDHEVIVKVDENTNTRIRFTRAAIQGIVGDAGDKE